MIPTPCQGAPFGVCDPDVLAFGQLPLGSLPTITADIVAGPFANSLFPADPLTAHGAQLDVQLVNTHPTCTISGLLIVDCAPEIGAIEPGARYEHSLRIALGAVNGPPPVITPAFPAFAGGCDRIDRVGDGAGAAQTFIERPGSIHQAGTPATNLAPGDFIWASLLNVVFATGFTGPSTASFAGGGTITIIGTKL